MKVINNLKLLISDIRSNFDSDRSATRAMMIAFVLIISIGLTACKDKHHAKDILAMSDFEQGRSFAEDMLDCVFYDEDDEPNQKLMQELAKKVWTVRNFPKGEYRPGGRFKINLSNGNKLPIDSINFAKKRKHTLAPFPLVDPELELKTKERRVELKFNFKLTGANAHRHAATFCFDLGENDEPAVFEYQIYNNCENACGNHGNDAHGRGNGTGN